MSDEITIPVGPGAAFPTTEAYREHLHRNATTLPPLGGPPPTREQLYLRLMVTALSTVGEAAEALGLRPVCTFVCDGVLHPAVAAGVEHDYDAEMSTGPKRLSTLTDGKRTWTVISVQPVVPRELVTDTGDLGPFGVDAGEDD